MKSHLYLLILLPCTILAIHEQARVKNQYIVEPYINELYTFQAGDVYQVFANEEVLSNDKICSNIIQDLVYFGKDAFDLYRSCEEKYIMLGSNHPLIEGERPGCFLNLHRSYCNYEIELHEESPHSNELREFITSTLAGCIKGIEPDNRNYFECPTLNLQTGIIEDEEKFCRSVENDKDYLRKPSEYNNAEEDLSYRVYSFVGANTVQSCMAIARLYNFCVNVSDHTGSDPSLCFSRDFGLYNAGAYIKLYNKRMMEKCGNAVLPFMAYSQLTEDLLNPVDTFGFCDGVNERIQNGYNFRANQVNTALLSSQEHLQDIKNQISMLDDLASHLPIVIKQLYDILENWSFVYHNMTSARSSLVTNTSVTVFVRDNLLLMNDTLADWVMQGRNSLSYLKETIPEDASLLNYLDPLLADFDKIELLGTHLIDFNAYIDQLLHQNVELNSQVNDIAVDEDNVIQFENLDNTDKLFSSTRQIYQAFLSQINQRKLNEMKGLNSNLQDAENDVARWEDVAKQIGYQMEMVNDYLQ